MKLFTESFHKNACWNKIYENFYENFYEKNDCNWQIYNLIHSNKCEG